MSSVNGVDDPLKGLSPGEFDRFINGKVCPKCGLSHDDNYGGDSPVVQVKIRLRKRDRKGTAWGRCGRCQYEETFRVEAKK